mgnify:CR=1 FL=1
MNKKRALSNSRFMNQGWSSVTYTYTINGDKAGGFVELSPNQLAGLYEPGVDVVERLLEYSEYQDAKNYLKKFALQK